MTTLKVGGVPEYFNLPIHLAKEKGLFEAMGIDLVWQDITQGTGRMAQLLADGALDMAIMLTEGAAKTIAQGNPSKIIHTYVESPLIWGIHTASNTDIMDLEQLGHATFAISRYGSGSHLMAILLAESRGLSIDTLNFQVVDNLEGARQTLPDHPSMVFLWEKYTTKFLVDTGHFRRIGEWPTPWPCFVVVASDKVLGNHGQMIKQFLDILLEQVKQSLSDSSLKDTIAQRYQLNPEDVQGFLPNTLWNTEIALPTATVSRVLETFDDLDMLDRGDLARKVVADLSH